MIIVTLEKNFPEINRGKGFNWPEVIRDKGLQSNMEATE